MVRTNPISAPNSILCLRCICLTKKMHFACHRNRSPVFAFTQEPARYGGITISARRPDRALVRSDLQHGARILELSKSTSKHDPECLVAQQVTMRSISARSLGDPIASSCGCCANVDEHHHRAITLDSLVVLSCEGRLNGAPWRESDISALTASKPMEGSEARSWPITYFSEYMNKQHEPKDT